MLKDAYTTKEMKAVLGVTVKSVHARAKREAWQSRPREAQGGGYEWLVATMPEDTRLAIRRYFERASRAEASKSKQPEVVSLPLAPEDFNEKKLAEGRAREDLQALYLEWLRKRGKSKKQRDLFIAAYMGGMWPDILRLVGPKSWKTIERWKVKTLESKSPLANVDMRGVARRGKTLLTERHVIIILGQILDPNRPKLSQAVRVIQEKCEAECLHVPSYATINRFQQQYFQQCYDEWTYFRQGDKAFSDKCAISILRDWSLVEVGDIVVADGHTLNFETINPATGNPKRMTLLLFYDGASGMPLGWEIMATENVACISSAFRRTAIFLGKMPFVIYVDNGRAFRAKFFSGCPDLTQAGIFGLYQAFGCHVMHALPYHGQSKPVERFFGSLHEAEVMVPSYVGTCIDDKPARLNRGEARHRAMYEKMGGRPLSLEETHRVVAKWFGQYSMRPSRAAHLAGRTPMEVFQEGKGPGLSEEQLRALDVLMMTAEVRSISKDGIRLNGRLYWHQALQSRRHKLIVRFDDVITPYSVYCYDETGRFICEALDRAHYKIAYGIHPAAKVLGTQEQQLELREALELKRQQERQATGRFDMLLNATILPETKARQAALEVRMAEDAVAPSLVKPTKIKAQSDAEIEAEMAIQEAIRAEDALKAQAKAKEEEEDDYEPRTISLEEQFWSKVSREPKEAERYELILEAEAQGMEIPKTHRDFCRYFEQTAEYSRFESYFEERRAMYAMTYSRRESQTALAQ